MQATAPMPRRVTLPGSGTDELRSNAKPAEFAAGSFASPTSERAVITKVAPSPDSSEPRPFSVWPGWFNAYRTVKDVEPPSGNVPRLRLKPAPRLSGPKTPPADPVDWLKLTKGSRLSRGLNVASLTGPTKDGAVTMVPSCMSGRPSPAPRRQAAALATLCPKPVASLHRLLERI